MQSSKWRSGAVTTTIVSIYIEPMRINVDDRTLSQGDA